jgi:hypothetical protein
MKKIYLSFVALFVSLAMTAQVAVTFSVDMNAIDPMTTALFLAGNFNEPDSDWNDASYDANYNAAYPNWNGTGIQMTDGNADGVFEVTLNLNPARYEYKFVYDGNWETVPGACATDPNGNNNRHMMVGNSAVTAPTVCWQSCALCGENAVRLRVDMSTVDLDLDGNFAEPGEDISPDGVHVAGNFQNPYGDETGDWVPNGTPLQDWNNDNIWETTVQVGNMTSMVYKYINGNDWAFPNESVNGACSNGGDGNRLGTLTEADMVFPVYCWNSCDPCTQPVAITFQVNMTNACIDIPTSVNLMGEATNWGSGVAMSDTDGDNIWTLTLNLSPGAYAYKFKILDGAWEGFGGNRQIAVVADTPTELAQVCWGSADPCGPFNAPADVTFHVTPGAETIPSGQKMWLMGDFTSPNQWQSGALEMSDADNDGTWSVTLTDVCVQTLKYKFVIGADNTNTATDWTEESADFTSIGGCGVDNGEFSDNRQIVRTDANDIEVCWDFNTCSSCLEISVNERSVVSGLSVFPIPADQILNVNFSTPSVKDIRVRLVNNLGQVVIEENLGRILGQRNLTLNTTELANGIYSLTLTDGAATQNVTVAIK